MDEEEDGPGLVVAASSWKRYKQSLTKLQAHGSHRGPTPTHRRLAHLLLPCQVWWAADGQRAPLRMADGRVFDKRSNTHLPVQYPILCDERGELMKDVVSDFLVWLAKQPSLPKQGVKFAMKFVSACANLHRASLKMDPIDKGSVGARMDVRAAKAASESAKGTERLLLCATSSTRADRIPSRQEVDRMLHHSLSANPSIHRHPLRAIQAGAEMLLLLATGQRGEKARSLTWDHLFLHLYPELAGGQGMTGVICHNTRVGKTNAAGEAPYSSWISARDPMRNPSMWIGLCMLFRFLVLREPFPSVVEREGRAYKWLPVFVQETAAREEDASKALLSVRPQSEECQNACWNQMFAVAGAALVSGDSVTHFCKAKCQQEWREAGGGKEKCDEALGYDVSKKHYAPFPPLDFALQRAGYGLLAPTSFAEVDTPRRRAATRAGRAADEAVDAAFAACELPGPAEQERLLALIPNQPQSLSRSDVAEHKRRSLESKVRDHARFLGAMRHVFREAVIDSASRPTTGSADGSVRIDAPSLLDAYGSTPLFASLSRTGLFRGDRYEEVRLAVREEEEADEAAQVVSPDRKRTARAATSRVVGMLSGIQRTVDEMKRSAPVADPPSALMDTYTAVKAEECKRLYDSFADGEARAHSAAYVRLRDPLASLIESEHCDDPVEKDGVLRNLDRLRCLLEEGHDGSGRCPPITEARLPVDLRHRPGRPGNVARPSASAASAPSAGRTEAEGAPPAPRDGIGPQQYLYVLKGARALYDEYVGRPRGTGLRALIRRDPNWIVNNKKAQVLWATKCFFLREMARVRSEGRGEEEAVDHLQKRLDEAGEEGGSAGWYSLKKKLLAEQPAGPVRNGLNAAMRSL